MGRGRTDGGDYEHRGEYLAIEPPSLRPDFAVLAGSDVSVAVGLDQWAYSSGWRRPVTSAATIRDHTDDVQLA
jgi:hypothetical protein